MAEERDYWLGLSVFPGIGPGRFASLLSYFGSADKIWSAPENELKKAGLGDILSKKFAHFRKTFSVKDYKSKLTQKNVTTLILTDHTYPERLRKIPNPPFVLYVRGDISVFSETNITVAIVGTRKITSYGKEVTKSLTEELTQAGCVIVSGLAMGVDAIAHAITVQEKGKTIAVLGCGVDCCNPSSNQHIYNSILNGSGVVVSEFPLSMSPSIGSFPSRNRIIAGLSDGVIVTEGAEDSGALITASDAQKFGRKVFAVPGPITSGLSKGPNKLLANGADLVTSGAEVLDKLGVTGTKSITGTTRIVKGDTEEEQKVIDLLCDESLSVDQLVKRLEIPVHHLVGLLSLMELKGYITGENGLFMISPS